MPLITTWQSHVSYNAYAVVDLKVKIKIYAHITDTKYTSKISRLKYIENTVHIVNSPRNFTQSNKRK